VTACFGSRDSHIQVQGGGICHDNGIWFLVQGAAQVSFYRDPDQLVIRQRGMVSPVQENILFPERPQVAQVPPTDRTQSSNQKFHCVPSSNNDSK
jgi:hypothetical protein